MLRNAAKISADCFLYTYIFNKIQYKYNIYKGGCQINIWFLGRDVTVGFENL